MKASAIGIIIVVVVVVIAAGAYMALAPAPAPAQPTTPTPTQPPAEKLKVAVIYISPLEGKYWNLQLHDALTDVLKEYDLPPYKYTESVAPPDAERIARTYIDEGYKLIFFHSWFPDAIKMIGAEYPEVAAMGAGGGTELTVLYPPPTPVPPNVGHYDTYLHEAAYLAGVLAGKMSKTNKFGIVAGFPVANANRYFNAWIEGIKSVNENAQFKLTWLYTWSDPPKSKEAAKALVEWGADFIYSDIVPGAEAGVEETGKAYIITNYRAEPELAPNTMIASVIWDLRPTVDEVVRTKMQDKSVGKEYVYTMATGGADFVINLPDKVPADVMELLNVLKQEILEGKFVVTPNINNPEQVWGLG